MKTGMLPGHKLVGRASSRAVSFFENSGHTGRGSRCSSRAFTLLEIILAIAVTAIVLVAMNAVFFTALRLHRSAHAMVDQSLPVQQALTILRRDLEGARPPANTGILSGSFRAGGISSLGLAQPVDLELYTTTGTLREDEPWSEVQRVAYSLRSSPGAGAPGKDLVRSITRNLLTTLVPQPQEQWMLGGVESIEFACFDGSQWRNYWDTTAGDTNLPLAVRVRVQLAQDARSTHPQPLEMVVPLDALTRTNLAGTESQ